MVTARPRADPNERPYLAWVQKHHIAGTLDHPETMEVTTVSLSCISGYISLLTHSGPTSCCTGVIRPPHPRPMLLLRHDLRASREKEPSLA